MSVRYQLFNIVFLTPFMLMGLLAMKLSVDMAVEHHETWDGGHSEVVAEVVDARLVPDGDDGHDCEVALTYRAPGDADDAPLRPATHTLNHAFCRGEQTTTTLMVSTDHPDRTGTSVGPYWMVGMICGTLFAGIPVLDAL